MSDEHENEPAPPPLRPPYEPPLPPPPPAPKPPGAPRGFGPPWLRGVLVTPFALIVQVLAFGLILVTLLPALGPDGASGLSPDMGLLLSASTYLLVVPALWLAWRAFGQASLADMGHAGPLRRGVLETVGGFAGGVALLSAVILLGVALGAWEPEPGDWRAGLRAQAWWLPALLLAAYFEELLVRGWVMQDLGRRSPLLGLILSSVLFAVMHGANQNLASNGPAGIAIGLANIFLAGLLLGALVLLTGRLWLATGLHLGWNWTTAVLFGLPVSGYRLPSLMATEAVEGSGLWSGGAFGPEGSIPGLLLLGPVALLLTGWALKKRLPVPIVARHPSPAGEGDIIPASGPEPEATA